ncbi:hypothetical protein AB0454_22955 [Streptomyces sp. NPDC093509]|uniref:hypothetical protein n=1 Tax=Streptomyces sp. NPDC093509 TaxID=3154982 RepID=UPI00344FDC18
MSDQPIGPILDGLGTLIDLDDGDLIASALVIAKVVDANGKVALSIATSDGLSWIDQNGLLTSAQQVFDRAGIGRPGDEE